jgi:arylsulfatase A-like enzyme
MKSLVAALAALLAVAALSAPRRPRPASAERPDIVLIVIDALRRDRLPFYGYARPTAPFLASLAAGGTVFENAYSTSAWTAPATTSLHTSLYPFQHGVVMGRLAVETVRRKGATVRLNRIPRAATTLAEALRQAGYATYAITQNPNLTPALGFDRGFTSFDPVEGRAAGVITRRLGVMRPRIRGHRPYFLYLHYMDVHGPYKQSGPFVDPNDGPLQQGASGYDNGIVNVDDHIRQAFERYKWRQGTVVLVTADHGEELGDHGGLGHAHNLYAETLNVPLLVYGVRGAPAGRRVASRVSHVDVLPTLRALAGGRAAASDAGVSLLPLLLGRADAIPERALFADLWHTTAEPGHRATLQATIAGPWKLIDGPEGPELFHLDADPRDARNQAAGHAEIVADLRRRFAQFAAHSRKPGPEFEETVQDAETNEELRALGYVN